MEDIKIYRSTKRTVLWTLLSLGCIAFMCFLFKEGRIGENVVWFSIAFLSLGSLTFPLMLIVERINNRPNITIKSDRVILRSLFKAYEVQFEDVEAFTICYIKRAEMIGIQYNKMAEREKTINDSLFTSFFRESIKSFTGISGAISTAELSISTHDLCNILNARLAQYKANK